MANGDFPVAVDPSRFLDQVWTALQGRLVESSRFACGDLSVEVEAPNSSWLSLLTRAITLASDASPDLRLRVIGREELSLLPPFPLTLAKQSSRGQIPEWCDETFLAVGAPYGLFLADRKSGRALIFYDRPSDIPTWDLCAPFRIPLGFLLPQLGYHLVHGAAVHTQYGGCLLVGKGGSGKSSSALVALSPDSRLGFLGEDYLLVEQESLTVHPFYRSLKVDAHGQNRMPWLSDFELVGEQDGKSCRLVPYEKLGPASVLKVLLWPDRESAVASSPIGRATALRKFAPSSLFQNPNAGPEDFRALVSLCRGLESFSMGLGDSPTPLLVEKRILEVMESLCIQS